MGRRRKKEKGKVLASGDLKRTLQSRAGQLRRKALTELERSHPRPLKLRRFAKAVLESTFSQSERGAGSWSSLSEREPILLDFLASVLKKTNGVVLKNGEAKRVKTKG